LSRITVRQAALDRRLACLRVIEAIRLHAAANGGKLPARLDEITEVPLPVDPMTGRSFDYEAHEDQAVLSGRPPSDSPKDRNSTIRYELNLVRSK
jgi:hypothetical protein